MSIKSFLILIVSFATLLCNDEPHKHNTPLVKVHINGGSYLIVHGRTNLTKFHCQYVKSLSDTLLVRVVPQEPNKLLLEHADINLRVMQFDYGNKLITKDFQKLLQVQDFPELKIEALDIASGEDLLKSQNQKQHTGMISSAKISVTIAGRQNEYNLEVNEPANGSPRTYSGSLHINIRDFGLIPPRKLLGLMKVNENVHIDFYLNLSFSD